MKTRRKIAIAGMLAIVASTSVLSAPQSASAEPSESELARVAGGLTDYWCWDTNSCPDAGQCLPWNPTTWKFYYNNLRLKCSYQEGYTCNYTGSADCYSKKFSNSTCTSGGQMMVVESTQSTCD